MKEIYCISTGEYSDWRIVYAFENKEKRDLLLATLGEDYNSYDIELDDYRINIEDIKDIFTMSMTKNYVSLTKVDPIDLSNHRSVFIDRGELYSLTFIITKEQYELGEEYIEEKYRKVWHDINAKIKHMHLIDNMRLEDIENILCGEYY